MKSIVAACLLVSLYVAPLAHAAEMARPRAGKVEFFHLADLKPGMQATAWTVFNGTEPEPVPIEIVGVMKNAWGPKQDIIIGKMGGKAIRTSVAAGMSGSPVYIDGKLLGALSLRFGAFSPDAICGITPIDLMMEIHDFDKTTPSDARAPLKPAQRASLEVPGEMMTRVMASAAMPGQTYQMVPIDSPMTFSGFSSQTLQQFSNVFQQMGVTPVQGGASSDLKSSKPSTGWQKALQPGEMVAAVLVSGDMSSTVSGTITYNDGKKVLAFGHPMFSLGPVDIPMSKAEVVMVFPSTFQPFKMSNATEVVGALKQDRHSGIMGELGATAEMVPVTVKVRSHGEGDTILKEKDLHFNVFVHQKWTPYLMMVTLFNSIEGLNDFADEATYRLSGNVEIEGQHSLNLSTMVAPSEMPVPPPMVLAGWWGDKFNRLFLNSVQNPKLKSVNVVIDLLPERRVATIENAWIPTSEVEPGAEVPVRVFLRPYRGDRIEREFKLKLPVGITKGDHRILLSDADTLNRMQSAAGQANRFIDIPQTVSLLNQERSNNNLYVSVVDARPTVYSDDKTMPSLPASVLNVMQTGRTASRSMMSSPESATEQKSIPMDQVVNGSYSLKITVK